MPKDPVEFYVRAISKDGRDYACIECRKEQKKEYYIKNKERLNKKNREYWHRIKKPKERVPDNKPPKHKTQTIYAVYKGEKFITEGNSYECAEFLGVKRSTIYTYSSESYMKRCEEKGSNNHTVAIRIN